MITRQVHGDKAGNEVRPGRQAVGQGLGQLGSWPATGLRAQGPGLWAGNVGGSPPEFGQGHEGLSVSSGP